MSPKIVEELAPTGVLRAAINLSNFLLVTGRNVQGGPTGVSPDIAQEVATRLGVELKMIEYKSPGEIADDAGNNAWDIANIGAEPQRAEKIDFTNAYSEIQATYLVPENSSLKSIDQVDQPGIRIAVSARSAYDLWLERNIRKAELIRAQGLDASFNLFVAEKLDALAGLRPKLIQEVEKVEGSRILPGQFTSVQQCIGCNKNLDSAAVFLQEFVDEAKTSGMVAQLIKKHHVSGRLSVAGGS